MRDHARLVDLWMKGALLLLLLLLILGGAAAVVAMVLTLASELLGLENDRVLFWTAFTAPIWAPVPASYVARLLPPAFFSRNNSRRGLQL